MEALEGGEMVSTMKPTDEFRYLYKKLAHYHTDGASTINALGPLFEQIITIKDAEIDELKKKIAELESKTK